MTTERHGSTRLTLTIKREGQEHEDNYIVKPLRQAHGLKVYQLWKQGAGEPYITGFDKKRGGAVCDCADQTKNHPPGGCKHIRALKAHWLIY